MVDRPSQNMVRIQYQIKKTNKYPKRWKRSVSYGYRWIAETVFSSIKRTFGEYVAARKFPHMVKEIFLKAALYNMFNRMI
jgi:hypothetical protein